MDRMKTFLDDVRQPNRSLLDEVRREFVPKPNESCSCGKPVVFHYPATTYRCSRCGERYRLVVKTKRLHRAHAKLVRNNVLNHNRKIVQYTLRGVLFYPNYLAFGQ